MLGGPNMDAERVTGMGIGEALGDGNQYLIVYGEYHIYFIDPISLEVSKSYPLGIGPFRTTKIEIVDLDGEGVQSTLILDSHGTVWEFQAATAEIVEYETDFPTSAMTVINRSEFGAQLVFGTNYGKLVNETTEIDEICTNPLLDRVQHLETKGNNQILFSCGSTEFGIYDFDQEKVTYRTFLDLDFRNSYSKAIGRLIHGQVAGQDTYVIGSIESVYMYTT